MNWSAISFVTSSHLRFKILILLKKSPKTPSDLNLELETQISNVSKTLRELEDAELVKCLTPDRRKKKFYSTTEEGLEVLKEISNITKD